MNVERKLYIGVVEDNYDPKRLGRIKVRVQTLYHKIKVEDIPWASPFSGLAGKDFKIPAVGKLVNVMFFQNDLYDPYYIFSENYNINLQNKLKNLSDEEYKNFIALLFDERTQISADSEELTIDHLFNKITINNDSINLELKDNNKKVNLGSRDGTQDAVLGSNFFEWMDRFIDELSDPHSLLNGGGFVSKPKLNAICFDYKRLRRTFVSNYVKIVDNKDKINNERIPETDSRKNDVDLIISDNDEEQAALLAKIENQNEDACKKLKKSKSSSFISMDENVILPLEGDRITSRFGLRKDPTNPNKTQGHGGIDIAAATGTPIKSPMDGVVIATGFDTQFGGGNYIRIKHNNDFISGYAHLSEILVKKDKKVKQGDIIGLVGNTGVHSTGPHLHFTFTTPVGDKVDPELYFTWPSKPNDESKKVENNGQYQGQDYEVVSNHEECSDNNIDFDFDISSGSPLEIEPDSLIFENRVTDNKEEFIKKVKVIAKKLKTDPNALMSIFFLESGVNHKAVNSSTKATGLIQFMPNTARSLNTTIEELMNMTNVEQLNYVYKYFLTFKRKKLSNLEDLYLAVFFPAGLGKDDDWVIKTASISANMVAKYNPGFDLNKNKEITIKEFKKALYLRLPEKERLFMINRRSQSNY